MLLTRTGYRMRGSQTYGHSNAVMGRDPTDWYSQNSQPVRVRYRMRGYCILYGSYGTVLVPILVSFLSAPLSTRQRIL